VIKVFKMDKVELNVFSNFLMKNESRELTIEREGKRLTLKGHNLQEERQLVAELFPEALREQIELPNNVSGELPIK
jgi:hypothetical protein